MFEKVNPGHPDKVADRIAGALVDLAYTKQRDPRIAVEVLLGHGTCHIIAETSTHLEDNEAKGIVDRIAGPQALDYLEVPQDPRLAENQSSGLRCGDNGIFRGLPPTPEQALLSSIVRDLWRIWPSDGKFVLDGRRVIACQSKAAGAEVAKRVGGFDGVDEVVANPLGSWTGGPDVDSGATNRKLGSDMGDAVTGGGLHGKDLSKADVSVNIYAHLKAIETGKPVELCCAIGDETIDGRPYAEVVEIARAYITDQGGFEQFAAWGLV